MYLNKYFNARNIDLYIEFLKNTKRSDSSIKRKISSISSFQKFLLHKKYIEPIASQFAYNTDASRRNIFSKIKNIFAIQEVYPPVDQDPKDHITP